jgi:hypothetical protein
MGQFVHCGFDLGERAHARKISTPLQLRQAPCLDFRKWAVILTRLPEGVIWLSF